MPNEELLAYIKNQLAAGRSRIDISNALMTEGGWLKEEVDSAFLSLETSGGEGMPPSSNVQAAQFDSEIFSSSSASTAPARRNRFVIPTIVTAALVILLVGVYFLIGGSLRSGFVKADTIEGFLLAFTEGAKNIDRFSYEVVVSAHQEPRDENITPISLNDPTRSAEKIAMAERDLEQMGAAQSMIFSLASYYYNNDRYPENLSGVGSGVAGLGNHTYSVSADGKTAYLSLQLEAEESARFFSDTKQEGVSVDGRKVTLTLDGGSGYFSFPYAVESLLPKSSVVQGFEMFGALVQFLPERFKGNLSFSGVMGAEEGVPDSRSSISSEVDWGDMVFKVGAEAIVKDEDLYARVNNFPSIPLLNIDPIREKWIRITKEDLEEEFELAQMLGDSVLREGSQGDSEDVEKAIGILADALMQHNPLMLKESPRTEQLEDGRAAVRYSLGLNAEKVADFVEYLTTELVRAFDEKGEWERFEADLQRELAYLKSDGFVQLAEYLNKNAEFIVWLDRKENFPIQLSQRIVYVADPNAESVNLFFGGSGGGSLNSQLVYSTRLTLSDINKTIDIQAPVEFMTPEEAMELMMGSSLVGESLETVRLRAADATVRSSIGIMRAPAAIYYEDNGFSYVGLCEDADIVETMEKAREAAKDRNVSCHSSVDAWAAEGELVGGGFFCVDDTGYVGDSPHSTISASDMVCG